MDAWWSYRPADLLMFSLAIYWRLFESLNRQAWPFGVALWVAGVLIGCWWARTARRSHSRSARSAALTQSDPARDAIATAGSARAISNAGSARGAAALLALAWLGVAWAFFWQRFAPVNTAAVAFAWLFVGQALGLGLLALSPGLRWASALGVRARVGLALGVWALIGHPALAWVFGRPSSQAEWLGLAPDPTAIGALALLLVLDTPRPLSRALWRALWVLPLGWCAVTSLTLQTLGEAQAGVVLALAGVALAAAALGRR
jgi:hypothetical protein